MEPQSTVKSMWVYFDKNLEITTHNKNKRKDHSKPVYPRIQQTEEYFTVFMILYGSQIRMKRQWLLKFKIEETNGYIKDNISMLMLQDEETWNNINKLLKTTMSKKEKDEGTQ